MNNVEYYRFFELAVCEFLMRACAVDLLGAPVVPFVAESLCRFRRPLSWPHGVTAGLRVDHIGRTSVRYAIALFQEEGQQAAADGHWVHVFVERVSQQPADIPGHVRQVFEQHR